MKKEIEKGLSRLIGLPFSAASRAGSMAVFKFGEVTRGTDKWGNETEETKWSLNIQCCWRISNSSKIITASHDLYLPSSGEIENQEFNWEEDMNLFDEKIKLVTESVFPIEVVSISADELGGAKIYLSNRMILEIFPDESGDEEFWRIHNRSDANLDLVVAGNGIED
ncbi:hypothetical protein ACQCVE_11580 [Metabacillus sp. 113a]|uniref:hypothetical protein n=1 Tax=Metabacillus sp. 113a TaxID=3404706 RepID=UPI003CF95DA6